MDEMSKFVASVLILGSLDKLHMLSAKFGSFFKMDQMLLFSTHKIRFCSFGSLCYVVRVGVTSG